jgi:hypothetical protein
LRAGPLSNSEIVQLLNREFVSAWLLLSNLEHPKQFYTTEQARRLARVALQEFDYPVETQVFSSTGCVLEQLQYNALLDVGPNERSQRYLECLRRSLETTNGNP